ncbi:Xaa-Pro aminopeptidase [Catalinimonas alkaloidigena]|uniref:Xaa-Pro aminopeptidase n=1 Tax=Catalinimonas alkaloidigena TaxID=1075417 RepID=A0A1G8ZM46_9BACT|nr:aminopeptidase P N-terminal domain-containing protein [Catalinimonas alkaloidigena]SDK16083.1 Xaa-Pro aminopeptidase [Catalinimonas alkaloidigena]
MRYESIGKELFTYNRKQLADRLKPNALAVFNANDIMPTNADGTMPFRQNNDLFYLSGIDQEESILLIYPDCPDPAHREVLFLRETNEHIAIWEGHKYTKEEARETSGIEKVYWLTQFPSVFQGLMAACDYVYLNSNEHTRAVIEVETRDARFIREVRQKYPLHHYERVTPLMHQLRAIKSKREVELIQKACNITEKGFRRVLEFVRPGVMEFEIEAEYAHEFLRNRSKGFAYTPIIASGHNACVLHYIANDQPCQDGDLLLMDVGAEYANYASDMTRTIPVSGRFTPRQREVYDAVLRVMRQAAAMLRPGNTLDEYHKEVGRIMESELIGLRLLEREAVKNQDPEKPLYKKYFMHGTSHHLGLDVHDVGNKYRTFEPGMVFTCEPGIYIREEGIGIRLENDFLVTSGHPVDLMANIPLEAEEIEEAMQASVKA